MTGTLSTALARPGFFPVHDRGRVLVDTAVCIADGGRVLSDLATLRDQGELYGPVASDPTLWRALEETGAEQRGWIAAARAKTRRQVWGLIEARHGQIPPSTVADLDLGPTVVLRMDATIQIAHRTRRARRARSRAPSVITRWRRGVTTPASPWRCCSDPGTPGRTPHPTTSRCSPTQSGRSRPRSGAIC